MPLTHTQLPHSAACDRNREPILAVLREYLPTTGNLLEIGSGTGQHAVAFAPQFPQLRWQPSDRPEHLAGIQAWLRAQPATNLGRPIAFDVEQPYWPSGPFEAIYSANTLHIMSWAQVKRLFAKLPSLLAPQARLLIYGPFNYAGDYSSPSNREFDCLLKQRDPDSGIRDFEAVDALATQAGLKLLIDQAMPANNQLLVWESL